MVGVDRSSQRPAPQTSDLRVAEAQALVAPAALRQAMPLTPPLAARVVAFREEIVSLLRGAEQRLLVVVGPCSIHDPQAALAYAEKLLPLRQRYADELLVVMRVYFEKPRTSVGWKGLINDPHLDGSYDVPTGLQMARQLLLDVAQHGLPAATELLDPIVPQYIADLISWTAIGARTTESQTHREMASGLSMPVGFKNGTDGSLSVAVHAMQAARQPHSFLGIDAQGQVCVVRTTGNPDTHVVLRGGTRGANFRAAEVAAAAAELQAAGGAQAGMVERLLVDCSHANSGKDFRNQRQVVEVLAEQLREGSPHLLGVMIESHLVAGRQNLESNPQALRFGQSITDACIDLADTEAALESLAQAMRHRRTTQAGGGAAAGF